MSGRSHSNAHFVLVYALLRRALQDGRNDAPQSYAQTQAPVGGWGSGLSYESRS
jgi:hypothetical protein